MSDKTQPAEPAEPKMVRIRAIVAEDRPWSGPFVGGRPLAHKEEAIVPEDLGLLMDERRQCMIIGDA